MLRKSNKVSQLDLFSSPSSLFSGKIQKDYEDSLAWHNTFRNQVTMCIDEEIFSPLYSAEHGRPNASIRVLVAMMILKEAESMSDQKIFENCRYNLLYRSALGLMNMNDSLPTESTYYLFRKRIVDYAKEKNVNLFSEVFSKLTKAQCNEFEVSGQRIRMDSKLLGSNIMWMSQYELIHNTLSIHYKVMTDLNGLDEATRGKLEEVLKIEGKNVIYIHSSKEVKKRLVELGGLIIRVLELKQYENLKSYQILKQVFIENFSVDENQLVVAKPKEEISASSIQSPYDTDCTYRYKAGDKGQKLQKIKGYSANVTETCDDGKLNLIVQNNVQPACTSDVTYLQSDTNNSQQVVKDKIKHIHADGAYHSAENHEFCQLNDIDLHLTGIQGIDGRYEFELLENSEMKITDTQTQQEVENTKITAKDGSTKWRVQLENGYRYFTTRDLNNYNIRQKLAKTPKEILQKRNNVEATIFQLGYHYRSRKSRYRGLIQHQMWSNMRCLWVNFVRIGKHLIEKQEKGLEYLINILRYAHLKTVAFLIALSTSRFKEIQVASV